MAGQGYDIGAAISGSSSEASSLSGATEISSGGTWGGSNTGPGSLILTDQRGSLGASSGGISLPVLVALLALAAVALWLLLRKGG